MIRGVDGHEIKRLRETRKLTQPQLAQAIGVGARTVSNWETGATVPKNRLGMLRAFFGVEADDESADPIRAASEVTLLAELMRRAAARQGNQSAS